MNPCRLCKHAVPIEGSALIRCAYPVPVWITMELEAIGDLVGRPLVDHLNGKYPPRDCPTYQPREERKTQP